MEHMDISYGDAGGGGGGSDMICDEEMHECSGHEDTVGQEFPHNTLTNEPDLSVSGNMESAMISDAPNATVLLNSSFPTDDSANGYDSIRFPLQDAKGINHSNIIHRNNNSIESAKVNLLKTPTNVGTFALDKENMFAEACESWSDEFPTASKGQSGAFPVDVVELAPVQAPAQYSLVPDEHFTPANEYNFSAADFDCLLSRGGTQHTKSTVTSTVTSASPSSAATLPRNSVLINFDPLLRRQTIIQTETSVPSTIPESPSACQALVNFAQQQRSDDSVDPISDLNANPQGSSDPDPLDSALLLDALIPSSLSQSENQLGTDPKDKRNHEEASRCLIDTSLVPTNSVSQELSEDSLEKTVVHQENEIVDCSKHLETLLSASSSSEQEKSDSEKEKNNECLVVLACSEKDSIHLLEHKSALETPTESNPSLTVTQPEELTVDQFYDTNFELTLSGATDNKHTETEVTIKQVGGEINSTTHFPGAVSANDDLTIHCGNMIAEPYLENQTITVKNMSEERSIPIEEGCVEAGKKCKNEEVNIADIEKKMHDVELREESMLKRITEKDKTISKMSNVVEAYERTIAELISEKEVLIRNHEIECESLKQDNEINAQHLESLEKTFSNLYAKYERMKKNAIKYKENEEKLLEKVMKLEECLRAQEQRYEKMKSHAMSQLEIANTKIDEAIRNHSQESAKLKAQIKKEELYRISINEQLIQKSKENEELVKICDELISETN